MNLQTMSERQRLSLRKKCLSSLYAFCVAVMGYDDITEELHGAFCRFLEGPESRKQTTMPRSFVKTWIASIAYPVWISLPRVEADEFPIGIPLDDKFYSLGPNIRILVASYVISNSEKMIGLIRKTYESNVALQFLFPEVIPENFKKVKWSNNSACIKRPDNFTESTFEAAGIGGSSTSRHYDLIIEDDLIYANKDDFTGKELQPNQEDIDKAIGWHKLCSSLLVPGKHTRIHNQGTRWAKHDLVDYIWTNEPDYAIFRRACVKMSDEMLNGHTENIKDLDWKALEPSWNECYDHEQLGKIAKAQGPYMFATQYLLMPMSPEELLFRPSWIQEYRYDSELPKNMRIFTTVDLSEWTDDARKKGDCSGVVLTCGWCDRHHCWLLHYDVGRFNPSEVIMIMAKHWKAFSPERIGVESVYYQKALAHFAREYMDEGKVPRMTIAQLVPEANKSKELRIRALEPLASNLAIHCKATHVEFRSEFSEYIPNNKLCKKDILDALAYQVQIARPGEAVPVNMARETDVNKLAAIVCTADDLMDELFSKRGGKDMFGNPSVKASPFTETQVDEMLRGVIDPFGDKWNG